MSPEYEAAPGVNFSTLKYMEESPLAYRDAVDNGTGDRPSWTLGRASHTAFLEPHDWLSRYILKPDTVERVVGKKDPKVKTVKLSQDMRIPEYRELVERAKATGCEVITKSDHDRAVEIARAALLCPRVSRLLRMKPETERSIFWECMGVQMKSRLDLVKPGVFLGDLKSFAGKMHKVEREIFSRDRNYCAQAAMYHDAWEHSTGEDLPFIFIFVQSSRPYDVSVRQLSKDALQYGREAYREWLMKLKECQSRGAWPGADGDDDDMPLIVELPHWLQDDDVENEGYNWEESA